jgi:AraC family transcriptional regulator
MPVSKSKDESYLEFYQRVYGDYLVERRVVDGKEAIGMFVVQQPEGSFPDDAMSTYNLQLNVGNELFAAVDLGSGTHQLQMKRGEFVIAPAQTKTAYTIYDKHRLMCLGIPKSFFDNAAEDLGINTDTVATLLSDSHLDPVVRHVVKECWVEANNNTARGALFVDANLMALSSRILSLAIGKDIHTEAKTQPHLSDAHFDLVCQFVDSNIDTSLRMKTLAKLVDMNEYAFSRAFKARTDLSPYQWVIDRRLTRAEFLLRKSTMDIVEIAFAVGFSSQSHMTNLFSQRAGVTPAEFRKQL